MFGITNTLEFSTDVRFVTIAGTTRLCRADTVGPQGVLYKRITSLQDAVDCGGLLLINPAGRWIFYCGDTLRAALGASLIGKTVSNPSGRTNIEINKSLETVSKYSGNPSYSDGTGRMTVIKSGISVDVVKDYVDYFAANDVVNCFGIVTAATRGHGVSHGVEWYRSALRAADGYAFMATDTAMNVTLQRYLADAKTAIISGLRSEVRGYYAAVYDSVAALDLSKPCISAVTCWLNGDLAPAPIVGNTEYLATNDTTWNNFQPPTATPWGSTPGTYPNWAAVGAAATLTRQYSGNIPGINVGSNMYFTWIPDPGNTSADGEHKVLIAASLGLHESETPLLPCVTKMLGDTITGLAPSPVGSIGTYQVGVLRDAHVFGRSLIDGVRYANGANGFANLAAFVNSTFGTIRPAGVIRPEAITSDAAALTYMPNPEYIDSLAANAFSAGQLPLALERFNARLDDAAKTYADANH